MHLWLLLSLFWCSLLKRSRSGEGSRTSHGPLVSAPQSFSPLSQHGLSAFSYFGDVGLCAQKQWVHVNLVCVCVNVRTVFVCVCARQHVQINSKGAARPPLWPRQLPLTSVTCRGGWVETLVPSSFMFDFQHKSLDSDPQHDHFLLTAECMFAMCCQIQSVCAEK